MNRQTVLYIIATMAFVKQILNSGLHGTPKYTPKSLYLSPDIKVGTKLATFNMEMNLQKIKCSFR